MKQAKGKRWKANERGAVLIMALVALAILAALGGTLLRWAAMEHKLLRSQEQASQARWLAEAGVERAAAQLARDSNYSGETWDVSASDLPSGEAVRVRIRVTPVEEEDGQHSIDVVVEYPLGWDSASRAHREMILKAQVEEAL